MALFKLEIHTRTIGFGESIRAENAAVAKVLLDAAHRIQSGHGPIPLKDNAQIPVATYEWGPEMLNGQGHDER